MRSRTGKATADLLGSHDVQNRRLLLTNMLQWKEENYTVHAVRLPREHMLGSYTHRPGSLGFQLLRQPFPRRGSGEASFISLPVDKDRQHSCPGEG